MSWRTMTLLAAARLFNDLIDELGGDGSVQHAEVEAVQVRALA